MLVCPCRLMCFRPSPDCKPHPEEGSGEPIPRPVQLARTVWSMPLFNGLGDDVMQRLMADSQILNRKRGSLLFDAGSPADGFFIVLSGQVKLFALLPDGRESVIEVIRPTQSFGEAAMLSGQNFPINAEIIEDATLVRVGRNAFLSALRSDHAAAYRMLAGLCAWHLRLAGEARMLKRQPAWQRVAGYLITLTEAGSGAATVRVPFTREVLASRIGIRRESLSRVLRQLRRLGVTSKGQHHIHFADVAALRTACATGVAELN